MNLRIVEGILIPFLGTSLGAATVFFLKKQISDGIRKALTGFAAGVMVAASFWSLLQPALDESAGMGKLAFLPAAIGFLVGVGFLLGLDVLTPHMHMDKQYEGPQKGYKRTTKLILAVTLHNIPEGMAVGVVYAGLLSGAVEPIAAVVTMLAAGLVTPVMPYFLAFAAGAMMYVVVEELIPEMSEGKHSNTGTIAFSLGFVLMMILDVALG